MDSNRFSSMGSMMSNRTARQSYCVPCVNCESLVAIDDIDRHSVICTTVSKRVTAVLKGNVTDEINFKISKLRESLQQLIREESLQENLKYLLRADELCQQFNLIQHGSPVEMRKLSDLNRELTTMTESFGGTLGIALYLERLHSLGMQKQNILNKLKPPQSVHENPNSYTRDSLGTYRSVQQNFGRPTMITKFSGGSQDRSPAPYDMKSEILTQMSNSKWDQEDSQNSDFENHQQYEQAQRVFYSKCLAIKVKYQNNHPSQKIPLCVLHKEAITKKIPQSQWDMFIQNAMNNPQNYIDFNKFGNTGIKNNLRSMTQEQQFKQRLNNL